MYRMHVNTSAQGAKRYYTESLHPGDYYVEQAGLWLGTGCKQLGLSGAVTKEAFHRLCDNLTPNGEKLTQRSKTRVGFDNVFDAPKSVSVLYAATRDPALIRAMRQAARQTMADMEREVETRVRKDGADYNRRSGNWPCAEFVHTTTRPLEDGWPDPHLHCHFFAFNASFCPVEQIWKAADVASIKRDAPYWQALYHQRLAQNLQNLGHGIRRTATCFEIEGIDQALIDRFSRRTQEIEAEAARLGIRSDRKKAELGAKTRQHKREGQSAQEVHANWHQRFSPAEQHRLQNLPKPASTQKAPAIIAREAIQYALEHQLTRASVVDQRRVLADALHFAVGQATEKDIQKAWTQTDKLTAQVDGRTVCSTPKVLQEEAHLLEFVRSSHGTVSAIAPSSYTYRTELFRDPKADTSEQKEALRLLRNSQDFVVGLRGKAGTGKTSLMQELNAACQSQGHHALFFAPTTEAARSVLRSEGFHEADTFQSLLTNDKSQARMQNAVVCLDEAGLGSIQELTAIIEMAREKGAAKVILSGDTAQHHAVTRGDALRLLENHGGLQTATLATIRRQKDPMYHEAVRQISEGHADKGFAQLDQMGAIREIADDDQRYGAIAEHYQKITSQTSKQTALVIAPTHKEGAYVTEAIREELFTNGRLDEKNQSSIPRLQNLKWTTAQKTDAVNYQSGLQVKFHQNVKGITRGERFEVMKQEGAILLFDTKGEIRRLPIEHADRFEVYQLGSMGLTKGDRLRITENGRALDGKYRLNNGKLFTLAGFTREGDLRLDNGKIVPRAYGHLDYGYCVTSYAAQGKTVDEVILALSENASGAINTREFYVDASRGKHRLIAFTDDKAYLRQAVQRPAERRLATEVWPEHLSRHQNLIHLEAYMRQREINPSRPIASPPNPLNPSVQSHLRQRKDRSRGIAPA